MKSLRKICQLLLIVVCAAPLLANASAIDINHPYDQGFKKSQSFNKGKAKGHACCGTGQLSFLSPPPSTNINLADGTYLFGQFESSFNKSFVDKWTFSLAEDSQANLTLSKLSQGGQFLRMLNTSNLGIELLDGSNHSLGSITSNQSLNLLLAANTQYSFVVSGSAHGKLGGFYLGSLKICPPTTTAVPIGDALPMFTAALLLLGWQFRMRLRPRHGTPHTSNLAAELSHHVWG